MMGGAKEAWNSGGAYERYVGRWSRLVAKEFLHWLAVPPGGVWGDVGCGTGALTERILAQCEPTSILAIDKSEGFLAEAQSMVVDARVQFEVADATALPWTSVSCDAAVSGLVLNFVPDAVAMMREMVRVTRPQGKVAIYVWDYRSGMEMMRHFWDAALEVNPADSTLDESERFPLCQPEPLEALFREVGLTSVVVRSIDVPTVFQDFDDYWSPFLGKQGAAPAYLASLSGEARNQIREVLKRRLAAPHDGVIALTASAWAAQGVVRKVPSHYPSASVAPTA